MTANQLVALNLKKTREDAGLTQEQAAQQLRPYLGKLWSKASFSVAEQSAKDDARTREFDANELLAFSQAFRKPIAEFFLPDADDAEITCGPLLDVDQVLSARQVREAASLSPKMRVHLRALKRVVRDMERVTTEEE